MTTVIVGMLLALLLAIGVVALVAVPARREGRELLTPQGEQLVQQARERVVDLRDRLPAGTNRSDGGSADSGRGLRQDRPSAEPPRARDR
jgi:hypothetical protein